jgi:hypothetical protein
MYEQRKFKREIYAKWKEALEFRDSKNLTHEQFRIKFDPRTSSLHIRNKLFTTTTVSVEDFVLQHKMDIEYHETEMEKGSALDA